MFVRIVKMAFTEEKVDEFLENFEKARHEIRNVKGNRLLELYRDRQHNNVFFTYSYWESEDDLENYRKSELFKEVWGKTKPLFSQKAEAWSVDKLITMP
ncbi:putative quinol monooxygenase [Flavobacterium rhizosphaerae]|uniref:Antibiotic biosynthesis monooxygenase family protein n=1 Tax=Flavobacterium rhizosphaerae TaxID=3163298 RepID=A0ABW8YW64_9FLAO